MFAQKAKLEILVPGYEKDKPQIKKIVDSLQKQLNELNRDDIAVSFYVGENEETKSWDDLLNYLRENTKADFYYFTDNEYTVNDKLIKSCLNKIKTYKNEDTLKSHGIYKRVKPLKIVR